MGSSSDDPAGYSTRMFYPVEGDSPIAEVFFGDCQWANIWLVGLDLTAEGDARVADARAVVSFFSPAPGRETPTLDLEEAKETLEWATAKLLENERDRMPVDDRSALNPAAEAMSKAGINDRLWQLALKLQEEEQSDRHRWWRRH